MLSRRAPKGILSACRRCDEALLRLSLLRKFVTFRTTTSGVRMSQIQESMRPQAGADIFNAFHAVGGADGGAPDRVDVLL